tara:strand:- start:7 stop:735 length:729 start_codon:yes stop_codon:yes gene_type:complete
MMFFFKSRPKLSELIPKGFVDIHSHILPGIDDGAKNKSQSKQLILELKSLGFSEFIATPHTMSGVWNNSTQTIKESWESLVGIIDKEELRCASEYMLDSFFIELLENEDLLCLKDKIVLIELSYLQPPINLFETLFELQIKGYTPVLAHPERYQYYFSDFAIYEKLKNAGCFFQLNLLSTIGHYGPESTMVTDKLLGSGLIDFVGSDVHHMRHIELFNNKIQIKERSLLEKAISSNQFFSLK